MTQPTWTGGGNQAWQTDPALFAYLNSLFDFTIDACASSDNALLPRYWTAEIDAATQDWTGERIYINPPFGGVAKFLQKAPTAEICCMFIMLNQLTARYFHKYTPDFLIIPKGRLQFFKDGKKVKASTFGTCFIVVQNLP